MIQSKNKFLPTLYIRKCKITYLECLLLPTWMATMDNCSLPWKHDLTLAHDTHAHEYMGECSDGVNDRPRGQAGALWGLSQREVGCTWDCGGGQTYTEHRKRSALGVSVPGCESVISVSEAKGKETRLHEAVAHSTSCQRKYYMRGFWFPPSSSGGCIAKFESGHPMELPMPCRSNL